MDSTFMFSENIRMDLGLSPFLCMVWVFPCKSGLLFWQGHVEVGESELCKWGHCPFSATFCYSNRFYPGASCQQVRKWWMWSVQDV